MSNRGTGRPKTTKVGSFNEKDLKKAYDAVWKYDHESVRKPKSKRGAGRP